MKFSKKLKTLMVAVAAVFVLAAPAYSWTYDDNGWGHRAWRRHDRDYAYRHWAYRPYVNGYVVRPYVYDPYAPVYRPGPSFGFVLPGFSVFVGP